MIFFILFVYVLCSVSGFSFTGPDPKCSANDFKCFAEISKSLLKVSILGNEELVSLDPLHQPLIENHEPELQFSLLNSIALGLKDSYFNNVTVTEKNNKKTMHFDITIPNYEMSGNYKLNGNLLGSPIIGEGKYIFTATDIHVLASAVKEFYEVDGKRYLKLVDIKATAELPGAVNFNVENLNNGDKVLTEHFLKVFNDNPKLVAEIGQKPITMANMKSVFDNFNKVLSKVPIDQLVASH